MYVLQQIFFTVIGAIARWNERTVEGETEMQKFNEEVGGKIISE